MQEHIGKIIRGVGGLYEILCEDKIYTCRAKGAIKRSDGILQIGDVVSVRTDEQGNSVIANILPRKNSLIRPPMANLDILTVLIPTTHPSPDLLTIDKLSAIAVHLNIDVVIVISKCDLEREFAGKLESIYSKVFPVFVTDSVNGIGIKELGAFIDGAISGKTLAFAGASGVGKSTLINSLLPDLHLETGGVSEKTERGRHTTRKVELFPYNGGFIADTPGFTMLDFEHFDFFGKDDLPYTFPEFDNYIGKCRYTKCSHTKEEGCAILDAVKCGDIAKSRHDSYIDLFMTLKNKPMYK